MLAIFREQKNNGQNGVASPSPSTKIKSAAGKKRVDNVFATLYRSSEPI